jgi:hypothetical protein
VPASALDGARYPVTIDPTASPARTPAPAGNRFEPAIAHSGGTDATHLVVWQEFVSLLGGGGQYDIYGAIVTADGIGGTSPKKLSTGTAGDFRPDVAWNGTNYLVVFEEQFTDNPSDVDIRGQFVDKNGNLVGSNFGIITTTHGQDVAWNGKSSMVAWQESRVGEFAINTTRLFADGTAENGHNGSFRIGYHHQRPSIASDGSRWLVVFEEKQISTGATDIVGIHLTADNFHDGAFPISRAAGSEGDPSVAYGTGNYLVVLTDRRFVNDPDVRAIRVNRQGALVDTHTFSVEGKTNENDLPAVSSGRDGGWAVGYEYGTGPQTAIRWRHVSK